MVEIKPDVVGMYAPLRDGDHYSLPRSWQVDTPTDFLFTGQKWEEQLGLYFYGSRFYDPC
jgi:hypothetical protein